MSDVSDDRKEPYDAGPSPLKTDKVTGRSTKRRSKSSRKSVSAVSSSLKVKLDRERSDAEDRIKKYFERSVISDHITGSTGFKTQVPVKIEGRTYNTGDLYL